MVTSKLIKMNFKNKIKAFYIVVFVLIKFISVNAQTWTALGTGFNNTVLAVTEYKGEIYAGGDFDSAGTVVVNHIAKWNGSSWSPVGTGIGGVSVEALAVYNGELYAGGRFSEAGGIPAIAIAKWNGTKWDSVGTGVNDKVSALYVYNSVLYVGGWFSEAGGLSINAIAKWNGTKWDSVGITNTHYNAVDALTDYNGFLYISGDLLTLPGNPEDIFGWDGSNWYSIDTGIPGNGVSAMTTYKGDLYVGSNSYYVWATPADYIGKWDGNIWSALGSDMNGGVTDLGVYNNCLYVGGGFFNADGVGANNIAKWDGTSWAALGNGTNAPVATIYAASDGLYVGGEFTQANGIIVNRIAKWTSPLGVEENSINNQINVYPNPFTSHTTLSFNKELKNVSIIITDVIGNEVRSVNFSGSKLTIEKEGLNSGIYFIQVISEKKIVANKKIVVG